MTNTLSEWFMESLRRVVQYIPDQPMLFNSGVFLVLFTLFITLYAVLYTHKTARVLYVLAFSLFFYYKSSGWYLLILLASIVGDYAIALIIHHSQRAGTKRIWLIVSVSANVALLGYFKYTGFFLQNLSFLSGEPFELLAIFLPIGISFYTFQTISYVVDVYKGEIKPATNLLDYAFYMSFFPHLVAGPIVRARHFLPQIRQDIHLTPPLISEGLFLVLKGLIKKAIIADYLAQYADSVFGQPEGYSGFENLMAIYIYTLQIYCDFSGYSDMAIGLAKVLGYDLGENFNSPYLSVNITEFWRRWHISLSSWLRDYVYIPLGGNRRGEQKQYLYLFLTMLAGGLWHGASWKFIFWGAMHGMGLIGHKLFIKYTGDGLRNNILAGFLGWLLTFHFVAFLWVFFRAENFQSALTLIGRALFRTDWQYSGPFAQTHGLLCFMLAAGMLIHFIPRTVKENASFTFSTLSATGKALLLILVIQLVIQVRTENVQPFIYFQF